MPASTLPASSSMARFTFAEMSSSVVSLALPFPFFFPDDDGGSEDGFF